MQIMRILRDACLVGMGLICSTAQAAEELDIAGQPKTHVIQYNGKSCMELKDYDGWSVAVFEPGDYCVAQDLHQSEPFPLFRLPHQPGPMGPLIGIRSSNVTVDLMGRHLSAKTPSAQGIRIKDGGIWPNGDKAPPYHTIKISNGTISTSKQVSVLMVHAWNDENKRFYHKSVGGGFLSMAGSLADYDGDITQYGTTEYILENLTLEADNHVIIMQGKKNVIRNCKIIGGNGTVNLYGPNLVFENNEIILKARNPKTPADEPPVALYLEDAADSIVRNNRIIIEGRASNADAIVLKNSPNVTLERNTITGTRSVYKLLDQKSSVKAAANTARQHILFPQME